MAVLLRHFRPCLHVRLISSSLFSSPSLKSQESLSLSPVSSLRGFVGYPRKYDADVFRAAGSYRDVHEMADADADADADAPTDSSEQKKQGSSSRGHGVL